MGDATSSFLGYLGWVASRDTLIDNNVIWPCQRNSSDLGRIHWKRSSWWKVVGKHGTLTSICDHKRTNLLWYSDTLWQVSSNVDLVGKLLSCRGNGRGSWCIVHSWAWSFLTSDPFTSNRLVTLLKTRVKNWLSWKQKLIYRIESHWRYRFVVIYPHLSQHR